jgi:hypothetical protein
VLRKKQSFIERLGYGSDDQKKYVFISRSCFESSGSRKTGDPEGEISETSFDNIVSSKLFKALAGIGGLVAFISSLVTILQGWPAVKELIDALK